MEKYIKIMEDNQEIHVTVSEEVYKCYYHYEWNEKKKSERANRCMIPGKNGKLIRCTEKCSMCAKNRNGTILSLDSMYEYIEENVPDYSSDPVNYVIDKEKYSELYSAINKLPEDDRLIVRMFIKGYSEAAIGEKLHLSQKGINKRKQNIFVKLRAELQKNFFEKMRKLVLESQKKVLV